MPLVITLLLLTVTSSSTYHTHIEPTRESLTNEWEVYARKRARVKVVFPEFWCSGVGANSLLTTIITDHHICSEGGERKKNFCRDDEEADLIAVIRSTSATPKNGVDLGVCSGQKIGLGTRLVLWLEFVMWFV